MDMRPRIFLPVISRPVCGGLCAHLVPFLPSVLSEQPSVARYSVPPFMPPVYKGMSKILVFSPRENFRHEVALKVGRLGY